MKLTDILTKGTLCVAMLLTLSACKTPTKISSSYAYDSFEVQCLGSDLDGSQTLRAWGKGKNKAQAIEQAKKNAVRAVLFKGVNAGDKLCDRRPVINVVNAEERFRPYFSRFFADGGEYMQFSSLVDEKRNSRVKSADNAIENWGVVVRVNRDGLTERMIQDQIINQ